MTARGGQNLLQGAVRIHASGRPHPARLQALLSYLVRALPLTSATLYLPDEQQAALSRRLTSTNSTFLPCLIPFGAGCAGRCAATAAPQTADRAALHPHEAAAQTDAHFLALPVRQGGKLAGVVSVGAGSEALAASARKALAPVLPLFASLLAALKGEEELQERQRHLALIEELSRLQCVPLAPGKLLPRLLRLCNHSGLSRCALVRLTVGAERSRLFKSCTNAARAALPAILADEVRLAAAALEERGAVTEEGVPEGSAPALCLPLTIGERCFGTLTFWGEPAVHRARQRETAETVGRLLAGALAEAISSEKIAKFYSSNEKKLKELSLLYRMSNTMLSTIQLNKLIHLTLTALTSGPTPFFDRAMLFLVNERAGVLQGMLGVTTEIAPPLATQGGEDVLSSRWDISEQDMAAQQESDFSKEVRGNRLELNRSLNPASRAVLEKKLIFTAENGEGGGAYAVAPLIAHNKVVGAVSVDNALSGAAITQEDLRFLQLFTNQAGMAIENSILYNRLEDANRQLCETQEHLLQRERLAAIGEMAAGIAHELKNPLVAIGGFAGRLTRKLAKDSREWGDADLIVREVIRLESILSEILFFSKKSGTCYVRCNLKQILRESLQVIAPGLAERNIGVSTRFCRRPLHLQGDPQQLKQVFINILTNAQDAMAARQGGQLKVNVSVAELDGKESVSVRISDTGGGIAVEGLHSIFTPFYTTKEKGTGLGLPIANRIVINHGGKIQVHNKPGIGAEFTVLLPLQQ